MLPTVFRSMLSADPMLLKEVGNCAQGREKVDPGENMTVRFGKIGNLLRDRATSTNAMGDSGLRPSFRKESTITILPAITRTCPAVYGEHQIPRSGNAGLVAPAVQVLEGVHRVVTDLVFID